ncbi:MAG: hypothetical protein ACYSWP_24190, partial [Planctomycetota bacterium]
GLAYHLGFASRNALADIAADKPEFSDTIARARLMMESERLSDYIRDPSGQRFDLQVNFGYVPKEGIEHTGEMKVIVEKVEGFK